MKYKIPVELYQQDNCILNHEKEIALLGKKALIITGRSSKRNGSLDDLLTVFNNNRISYEIFDEAEENPSLDQVVEVRNRFANKGIEFVAGVGGGSAMDEAKAVAILLYYPEKDGSFLYEPVDVVRSLPILCIPTTCGTGSEATPSAVLTLHSRHTKNSVAHKIFPTLSLVDSRYIATLPKTVLVNSAIDAFAHLVESHVNSTSTAYSRLFTREGLKTFGKVRGVLETGEYTKEEADQLMYMATLGGMSIALTGTSLPHGASYPVTYYTGMPHGKAVGYFQYGYLRNADEKTVREVLDLADFENLEEMRDFIVRVCQIERIDEEILEKSVRELMGNEKKLRVSPFPTSEETIRNMIFSL